MANSWQLQLPKYRIPENNLHRSTANNLIFEY